MAVLFFVTLIFQGAMFNPASSDNKADEKVIVSLQDGVLPVFARLNNVTANPTTQSGISCIEIRFNKVDWPNLFFAAPNGSWDWSNFSGIAVDVFNLQDEPIPVCMRVDNEGADGMNNCLTHTITAPPRKWLTMQTRFMPTQNPFWGMRGIPVLGPLPAGRPLDLSKIVAFQIFLPKPETPRRLLLNNIRLFGYHKGSLEELVPLPFVDKFGQYKHDDWPGKIHTEEELVKAAAREQRLLRSFKKPRDLDTYGGWKQGPQVPATGWFRTEKLDGKWWLITPEGHVFFSLGVDCVARWEATFVDKRPNWFEWLPPREESSLFQPLYSFMRNPHSMADPVRDGGWAFNFYVANLIRKYGEEWQEIWQKSAYARLASWGFNTLGAWSQEDVLANSTMPFVAITGLYGDIPRISAGTGYWSKMYDVYDLAFSRGVENCIVPLAKKYANNPFCIGYFVDNELGWHDPRMHTLACPPEQPCRKVLIKQLKNKYGTPAALAVAWEIPEQSWDELQLPVKRNSTCEMDLDQYVYGFARTYFETIRNALKKHAPNQLYLGCRFAGKPEKVVLQACADVVDVVSVNLYNYVVNVDEWEGDNDCGKPVIIGEFHFGARDRGMFHEGLCPTPSQKARAKAYARYVQTVAASPAFVGCHWFQYLDEPITGRWFDGENYNIGLVTITDCPYPELTAAATRVNRRIMRFRLGR